MKWLQVFIICITAVNSRANNPEIIVQKGHTHTITDAVFTSDSRYIYSSSDDMTVKKWDVLSGKEIQSFKGYTKPIKSLDISPDNKTLISVGEDQLITIRSLPDGNIVKTIKGHDSWIYKCRFSPNGKYFATSASSNMGATIKTLSLWDAKTLTEIRPLSIDKFNIFDIAFSPDSKILAAGLFNSSISIYEVETGKILQTISGHNKGILALAFSSDGKYLASASYDRTVKIWDTKNWTLVRTLEGHSDDVLTVKFSPDNKSLLSGGRDNTIIIWDVSTGVAKNKLQSHKNWVTSIYFARDGKTFISASNDKSIIQWLYPDCKEIKLFSGKIDWIESGKFFSDDKSILYNTSNLPVGHLWNLQTLCKEFSLYNNTTEKGLGSAIAFSLTSDSIFMASKDKSIGLWSKSDGRLLKRFIGHTDDVRYIDISHDGKRLISGGSNFDKTIKIWDIKTGSIIKSLAGHTAYITMVKELKNGKILSVASDKTMKLWNASTGVEEKSYTLRGSCFPQLSPDEKYLAYTLPYSFDQNEKKSIFFVDVFSGSELKIIRSEDNVGGQICFSNDGKYLISSGDNGTPQVWNLSTNSLITKLIGGHSGSVSALGFTSDNRLIISGGLDGKLNIWDFSTSELIVSLVTLKNGESIAFTPDGYFDCSKDGGEGIAMVSDGLGYNVDQLALAKNRPDIILKRLGTANNALIDYLHSKYLKRLKKTGFTEKQLSENYHAPNVIIGEVQQDNKFVTINFTASDTDFRLVKYNVFVNNVPLFGIEGQSIVNSKTYSNQISVELTEGQNKIEISCVNEKGTESYRALTYASYTGRVKKDIYILAFGVSKYQNSSYNLQFADKDALDLSKVIETYKGKGFENVYTKVLTNEQVTPEAIKASKDFVKNAKPDDTFILFIAGHGMHDKDAEATYYYLTSNADINNLKGTASDFETIEDLLQGIPPRNKLFLMDACESGEIDEEDQGQMLSAATGVGIASRGFKTASSPSTVNTQPTTKRSYLYQKDRYIYNDLVRRSGAIVFSSSKGGELSYERSDIENGLFTEYIMKALTTTEADKDNNGVVSTDELREYVSAQVAKASGDLQHPTVDRDNIYQKFGFGLRK